MRRLLAAQVATDNSGDNQGIVKSCGGFVGKLDGPKASEWKKCRCHQKITQRTEKKK